MNEKVPRACPPTEELRQELLALWHELGEPAIPLRPGEPIPDLEKFLSIKPARPEDLGVVVRWLQEKARDRGLEQGG